MTFDVDEVISSIDNGEKASLLSGMDPFPPVYLRNQSEEVMHVMI